MSEQEVRVLNVQFTVQSHWTLAEFCAICQVDQHVLEALVEEGVLQPEGLQPTEWRFPGDQLGPARTALRLVDDLGLNPAGVALAMQLMDEIEQLRSQLSLLHTISDDSGT